MTKTHVKQLITQTIEQYRTKGRTSHYCNNGRGIACQGILGTTEPIRDNGL